MGSYLSFYFLTESSDSLGTDELGRDPRFDFLNRILNSDQDDESLFFNTEFSPYNEINIHCSYIDPQHINTLNNNCLSVLSLNIQSLPAKYSEFSEFINELSSTGDGPDAICLQEIWQLNDPSLFPLNGFNLIEANSRNSARGGGVGIYIKNSVLKNLSLSIEQILETIFVEVITPSNQKFIIGSIYRPGTKYPGLTFTEQFRQFSETLSSVLSELDSKHNNVYLYGDFNLDALRFEENKFISEYIDTLFSYGFLQIVTKPTRVSDNSATLIDHILTNSTNNDFNSYIICSQISDHFPILHCTSLTKPKTKKPKMESRNFSTQNINRFKAAISNYGWNHVTEEINCPQEAYNSFINTFNGIFETFFPLSLKFSNREFQKIEPWMTAGILTSRRHKNSLCTASLKNPTPANKSYYKIFRNLYNKIVKQAKKNHIHNQLEASSKNIR